MSIAASPSETPRAVLFDVDGTLITTGGAGARAWDLAARRLYGRPADIEQFSDVGMTDPVVAARTFEGLFDREPDAAELAELLAAYLWHLPDTVAGSDGYRVLEGVRWTLRCLREADVPIGIVSGAVEAGSHAKLGRAGLNASFMFGAFGSDSADRDEIVRLGVERACRGGDRHLRPQEVLVVGDTPLDVASAQAVGARSVAVASHHFDVAALAEASPDCVLESLREPLPGLEHAYTGSPEG